jgi:hypothetical protein
MSRWTKGAFRSLVIVSRCSVAGSADDRKKDWDLTRTYSDVLKILNDPKHLQRLLWWITR